MNNWRLLLLAVLCTFQPILSEENPFNGRERCFLQRPEYLRGDTRFLEHQLSNAIPETRQVKSVIRRETREILGQRHVEKHGLRYSDRVLTTRDEGFDGGIGKTGRTRPNYRIREGFESRDRYYGERVNRNIQDFDQRYSSVSNRRESQIRGVQQGERTDIEARIRDIRLTRSLENYAHSTHSQDLFRENRRTLERDVIRSRNTLSRNIESHNTRNRRTVNQRQFESEPTRTVQNNARLQHNENDGILHREFVQRRELGESQNFRREQRTRSAKAYDRIRSLGDLGQHSNERLHQIQPTERRNERNNLRIESNSRSFKLETDSRKSPVADVLHINIIRRSNNGFVLSKDRKFQNGFRLALDNRVGRGDFEMNKRSTRDSQMRDNEVDSRDFTVRAIREEQTLLIHRSRDTDMYNRHRVSYRNRSVRTQKQFGSELQNKMRREYTTRNTRIDGTRFNRITNDQRAEVIPMKDNRIAINNDERHKSNILQRERYLENFRNIDNHQRENLDNTQRQFNRRETRVNTENNSRQNMERDNGRRLRMNENIRVSRENIRNIRITNPAKRDLRFSKKNAREENTRPYRINDLLTTSRGKPSEGIFTDGFELRYFLYIIQAIYLFGLFMTLPQSKDAFKKKAWIGIWSNTPKLIKLD